MIFNIPKSLWARVQNSPADIVEAGSFTPTENKLLKHIRVGIFKNACAGKFRIRLHTSKNFNKILASSEWSDAADVPHVYAVGTMLFTFLAELNLSTNIKYYLTIEADSSYIRTGDTVYMSWLHDSPFPTNSNIGNYPSEFPINMELFVK